MNWDPAKHPRKPKGTPEGGEFAALSHQFAFVARMTAPASWLTTSELNKRINRLSKIEAKMAAKPPVALTQELKGRASRLRRSFENEVSIRMGLRGVKKS